MTGYQYDPHAFDLMNELFTKQQAHMSAIGSYVSANCEASGAFSGILSPLHGHYSGAYNDAHQGLQNGGTIAQHCATKITESKQQVLADDKSAYDKMAKLSARAGHPLPPWHASGGSTGPLGEGKDINDKESASKLEGYLEWMASRKAHTEQGTQGVSRLLTDPVDPLKPGELTPDQWLDPRSVVKHLIQEKVQNSRLQQYQERAANDPGGHDASYFRQQDLLRNQVRFESGFASGQSFAQDHLHTDAGSSDLHHSPWLSQDGRETLGSGTETAGKVLNIATALPAMVNAGAHLQESQATSAELSQTAAGPSNTGSANWAANDKSNGEW